MVAFLRTTINTVRYTPIFGDKDTTNMHNVPDASNTNIAGKCPMRFTAQGDILADAAIPSQMRSWTIQSQSGDIP